MNTENVWRTQGPFANSDLGRRLGELHRSGSISQRRLADFVLRNPIRVSATTIEDMARATGVSAPTISRFARELGLVGFAEMRAAIAESVQTLMDPVAKLRDQLLSDATLGGSGATFDAVRQQIALIDSAALAGQADTVARRIKAARSVYVIGFGLSSHVAAILVLGLQPFHPSVVGVVEFGGTEVAAGRLMGVEPGDLIIAITFPRYANDIVQLARYARDRGAAVIALTDSPASPIASFADELILSPSDHPVLSSSMVAAVAVAETIVATVMLSDKDNAEKASKLTQAIAAYLHRGE